MTISKCINIKVQGKGCDPVGRPDPDGGENKKGNSDVQERVHRERGNSGRKKD